MDSKAWFGEMHSVLKSVVEYRVEWSMGQLSGFNVCSTVRTKLFFVHGRHIRCFDDNVFAQTIS
ncbi:hypothetical protein D8T49_22300 [Vibrio vulnificus]|nr:hypothetical protein FORC54_0515 [Vibrio vulnificus]EGQ7834929.1 hypothetical protein [Vibrio vulnificus]EHD2238997.1 hypothetical protein [Vibrio vulnificus]NVD19209.1 hypothetical protein [Vibrio vulnificus]RZP97384.1 hypothetical protein D8T37_20905 [Vibrio vulnificus]